MKKVVLLVSIFIGISSTFVYGQSEQQREQLRRELNERNKTNQKFDSIRGIEIEEINLSAFKLSKEDEMLITPGKEDKSNYDSLNLPDTKIVKLLNVISCTQIGDVELSAGCQSGIPGYGSYYSFRHSRHLFSQLSDIQLYKNWFVTAGFLTQGIIVSLGETEFEKLSLSSPGIKFLAEFQPAETAVEADKQQKQIENGIRHGNFEYNRVAAINKNYVYAMRTIAYRSNIKTASFDKREDTIVVFKVIRRDNAGNVTLIWRKLQKKKPPKIEIEK